MEAVPRWPTLGASLRNSFTRKNILGIFCWKITMSLKSLTSLQSLTHHLREDGFGLGIDV